MLDSTGEVRIRGDAHLNLSCLVLSGHRVANRVHLTALAEKLM
ncbi:hypothetical protein NCW_03559 [Burkholderia pseudomallei]|nr:hypothetical protein [Burkholderia pseudomallei]